MSSKFNKLSNVADVIDSLHKTPSYSNQGKPMVRCTDVKYGKLNLSSSLKVSAKVFAEFSRRYTPKKGDIIITRVGSYGITAIVDKLDFCLGQNTSAIAPKKINPRYLYLVLNSRFIKNQIESSVVGSTQKTLSLKAINNLYIPRFETLIEDKIAKIGGNFDDKIELNTQINQTLEQIAQALFKSWFVDFDPVKAKIAVLEAGGTAEAAELAAMGTIAAKSPEQLADMQQTQPEAYQQLAETAALFPSAMQDSELGLIPEGWCQTKIGDVVQRLKPERRYTKKQVEPYGKVPIYEQGANILLGFHNNTAGFDASPDDPVFIFGDHTCVMHLSCSKFDISANVIPIKGSIRSTIWTYYALQGKQNFQEYRRHWPEFIVKEITLPPLALTESYTQLIKHKYLMIESLKRQSQKLEHIRDTLLPKLLSGAIDLAHINTASPSS